MNMTNRATLFSLAAIAALTSLNGIARADDGGGEYNFPAALVADSGIRYEGESVATCGDLKRDAWFKRQLELTDGDGDPTVPEVQCRTDGDMIAAAPGQDE